MHPVIAPSPSKSKSKSEIAQYKYLLRRKHATLQKRLPGMARWPKITRHPNDPLQILDLVGKNPDVVTPCISHRAALGMRRCIDSYQNIV